MSEIDRAKKEINLTEYIPGKQLRKGEYLFINPCPICGHNNHFVINPIVNSYSSYSKCCKGGTIIDFIVESEGLSLKESIRKALKLINADDTKYYKSNKKTEKKKKYKLINRVYHRLTCMERAIREIENKDIFLNCLLSFFENYTMKFVKTKERDKEKEYQEHLHLCYQFKDEFSMWYDNYLKFERMFKNGQIYNNSFDN